MQLLPHSYDIESAVLGVVLFEKDKQLDVLEMLLLDDIFYKEENKIIFKAIRDLFERGEGIDMFIVKSWLESNKRWQSVEDLGYYLTNLMEAVVSSAHIKNHCRKLIELYIQRSIILFCKQLEAKAYNQDDAFDLLGLMMNMAYELSSITHVKSYIKMSLVAHDVIRKMQEQLDSSDEFTGVPTSFHNLNKLFGGWQPADLVIIAARPSVGKTAFTIDNILSAAKSKKVGFFSLEMWKNQIMKRMISQISGVSGEVVNFPKNGTINELDRIRKASSNPIFNNIFIDDTSGLNTTEFRAKCTKMVRKDGIEAAFFDYLQIARASINKSQNKTDEVEKITQNIKDTAKELQIPCIALAQLNRGADGKKPELKDIKDCGAIEQIADIVILLYRPTVNDIQEYIQKRNVIVPLGIDINDPDNFLSVIVAKNRNGKQAETMYLFEKNIQRFSELTSSINKPQPFTPPDNPSAGIRQIYTNTSKPFNHNDNG